jgi:hypothetical protein
MSYKEDKNTPLLDSLQVPSSLEKFIAELPNRYENEDINKEIESQMEQEWKAFRKGMKKNVRKKVLALSLSAAIAFCLFIGSAFVSPAMAQIVSSIPYLNVIFESKPLIEVIKEALDEKNYQYRQLGVSIREKEVTVSIEGPREYYNQVKSPIEELVMDILDKRNNDAYKVSVFYDSSMSPKFEELGKKSEEEEMKKSEKITALVGEVLEQYGHKTNGIGVANGKIHIDYIPNTEKRLDEIKNEIINKLEQERLKDYKIKFYLYDPKLQEREGRLVSLYHTITEGLTAKSEFKVNGTGYSNKKERFYIEVRTTLLSSDPDMEEVTANIEQNIQDFLQSDEALKVIKKDIYEIVILSKDKKELKSIKN